MVVGCWCWYYTSLHCWFKAQPGGAYMMHHQMETSSALLAICTGNSLAPGEFPTQRPGTRSFDVFFDLRLNKRLSKQSWGWWFELLSRPLWFHISVVTWPSQGGFAFSMLATTIRDFDICYENLPPIPGTVKNPSYHPRLNDRARPINLWALVFGTVNVCVVRTSTKTFLDQNWYLFTILAFCMFECLYLVCNTSRMNLGVIYIYIYIYAESWRFDTDIFQFNFLNMVNASNRKPVQMPSPGSP